MDISKKIEGKDMGARAELMIERYFPGNPMSEDYEVEMWIPISKPKFPTLSYIIPRVR